MKRYISYIACLALSIIAIGCVKSDIGSGIEQGAELTLQFSNSAQTTRATRANDSDNNEDLLNSVQLFFYPKGSESSNAVYTYTVANFPTTDANGKASTADTANKSTTVKIKISAGDLDKMFPNNATVCSVYAIANGPTPATTDKTDVASLKDMSIEADFTTATQASFVMDSDICTITKDGKNMSGDVELTRAAAKIELTVNASNIELDGKIYMPQMANMKVALLRGVKKGLVDDGSDGTPVDHNVDADYFNIDIDPGRGFTNGVQNTPFYSYSSTWKAGDDDEATLKLMIPWGVSADGIAAPSSYLNYIYEVPVNDLGSLVRNKFYKITLNVGVLGSLDETEPVTINPSYVVLDWGTGEVDVELSRPKYLVVDENSVVMNNINSYSVGYQSSDAISVVITKIEYPNLKTGNTTTAYNNTTGTTSTNGFTVSSNDNVVTLNHVLDNDRADGEYDYFPYTVTVVVKNTVSGFSETIVFKQYPAIYVDVDKNTDYDDKSSNSGDTSDNDGYVYINKGTSYGGVSGLSGQNSNPSMYIINISAIDSDEFIIGDPRSTTISNPTNSTKAPAIYPNTNSRNLTYYYPTEPASDKIIAPKFRIASSYGKTSPLSYEDAQRRCAFYQEDGYPAGRWRMPTPAEIKYMIQFANEGKIDVLLSPDTYYWSGYNKTAYRYNSRNDNVTGSTNPNEYGSGSAYVRCVYDEWYWGSEKACDIETFTWGDAPRPTN